MTTPNLFDPTPKEILLAKMAQAAVTAEVRTGFPALITLSQWAIESAWGNKPVPGFNYFGMKYAPRHYSFYWSWTTEYYNSYKDLDYAVQSMTIKDYSIIPNPNPSPDSRSPLKIKCLAKFASYPNLQSSIDDYIYLMTTPTGPYYKAFRTYQDSPKSPSDLTTLAISISKIYATSPNYTKLLLAIMDQSNIKSAIELARQAAITTELISLPLNPHLGLSTEPTTTLASLLDILSNGSSLSYTQPHFYLHPPVGPPTQISAWDLGFRPIVDTKTGKLIYENPESPGSAKASPESPLNNS